MRARRGPYRSASTASSRRDRCTSPASSTSQSATESSSGNGSRRQGPGSAPWPPCGRAAVGVDPGVGDAVVVDQAVHHRAQPVQPRPSPLPDRGSQLGPRGAHVAGFVDEFVVTDARAVTQIEQGLLGASANGSRPAGDRRRSRRQTPPTIRWCPAPLLRMPSPQHGTHAPEVEDARRADVGGYPGLFLP